jgi:hypothetical protein
MEKKFDKIYYRIINETPLLAKALAGVGSAIASGINPSNIIKNINPNSTALPAVSKAVGQIPSALKNLAPKFGKPLDIEKHKLNPTSFNGTKIFKRLNRESKEIVTARVTDVTNLKSQGVFTATLLDPNYIVIISKKSSNIPNQNKTEEYVVKKDYFNNIKKQFNEYMRDFLIKNNVNTNIQNLDLNATYKEIKKLEDDINIKNKDLKLLQNKKQQNTKQQNIKQNIFDSISTAEDEIENLRNQYKEKQKEVEDKKKFDIEAKNFMDKNLQFLPKKQNTFIVDSSESKTWYYA